MVNRLKQAFEQKEFVVTCELVFGRGASEAGQIKEFKEAELIWKTGRVHAISLTDNPGGNPALLADVIAAELQAQGITPLVHVSGKDRNRNQLQSQLYALQRQGVENLLVMTGDYPVSGWAGRPRPVFDIDSVQMLELLGEMNEGLEYATVRGSAKDQASHFFAGAVISPFKWTEAESILQYQKLKKKVVSGAQFIITQLGYDARKMQELLFYLKEQKLDVPVIANIYLLTPASARHMKRGGIPGCYMSDELLNAVEAEASFADRGLEARYQRAAKMIAVARGLGYAGAHIGGMGLTASAVEYILDTADTLQGQWRLWAAELQYGEQRGQTGGWYYYQPEVDDNGVPTGLNVCEHTALSEVSRARKLAKGYGFSRFFHALVLTKDKGFYGALKRVMEFRDRKRGLNRPHGFEHLVKAALYGCVDCGDCGLEACGYSCPMAQCPKCQRNGPCGGSFNGWCEVYPNERYCIYYKAYYRLKKYGELYKLDSFITPPNNWDFYTTSSWSNYTHERDNTSRRQYLNEGKDKYLGKGKDRER